LLDADYSMRQSVRGRKFSAAIGLRISESFLVRADEVIE
jgi:hypothetical protein